MKFGIEKAGVEEETSKASDQICTLLVAKCHGLPQKKAPGTFKQFNKLCLFM